MLSARGKHFTAGERNVRSNNHYATLTLREIGMRIGIIVALVSIFLSSCATTENYEKILNSWVGSTADNLVSSWGPPANSYPLSDGGRVLQYSNQRNVQIGGYTTTVPQTTYHDGTINVNGTGGYAQGSYSGNSTSYVQKTSPVQNIAMQCVTRFTVNTQGIITKWSWQGNDCKARAPVEDTSDEMNAKTVVIPKDDLSVAVAEYDRKNYASAFPLFEKLANDGNVNAENYLGTMYFGGQGVEKNYGQALYWYKKAAEKGLALAQKRVGIMYEMGYGVEIDKKEAEFWYKQAGMQK